MSKQIRENIVAPRSRAPQLPKDLDELIVRALAKLPASRFASAAEMRAAMQTVLDSHARRPKQVARMGALAMATVVLTSGLTFAMKGMAPGATAGIANLEAVVAAPLASPVRGAAQVAQATETPALALHALAVRPAEVASVQTESVVPRRANTKAARAEAKRALIHARVNARLHPHDVPALRSLAQAAYRAGDLREARRAGDAWCKIDASLAPRLLLSSALDASGRTSKARQLIEEYALLHPDAVDARQAVARIRRIAAMTAGVQR
jgi:hypothetical protein